jgi:hypothetical protein
LFKWFLFLLGTDYKAEDFPPKCGKAKKFTLKYAHNISSLLHINNNPRYTYNTFSLHSMINAITLP